MAVEDRVRHRRLRSLFPQAYATSPKDSALGVLLETLAGRLRDLDHATERAQRDKWLATADGSRDPVPFEVPGGGSAQPALAGATTLDLGEVVRPLEHLGSGLDLLRQPWEVDEQAYRGRVSQLARLLTGGLGTTQALVSFCIGALGAETCPQLERNADTTTGFGLEPGSLARCRTCQGGTAAPSGPCPLREQSTMSVSLVDSPRRRVQLERQSLRVGEDGTATINFRSESLFADRPEIELRVPDTGAAHVVPSFRSLQTGERIIVARVLEPGNTLSILTTSPHDPSLPPHRQRWVDRPPGSNLLNALVRVDGVDDNSPVIVIRSASFNGARFGQSRFADETAVEPRFNAAYFDQATFDSLPAGSIEIDAPAVVAGVNTWEYAPLDRDGLDAALAVVAAAGETVPQVPDIVDADPQPVALQLRWWTRPAARFLIRIPLTDAVRRVVAQGAADYVRRMVERVRPVGVTPIIDFLEPPIRESLEPSDRLTDVELSWQDAIEPAVVAISEPELPAEVLDSLDVGAFGGIFDVTPFDFSLFESELVQLPAEGLEPEATPAFEGLFDVTPFDLSRLAE